MKTFFAIRKRGTDLWMLRRRSGRGYTNDAPQTIGMKDAPRLFVSRRGAILAISAWAEGVWARSAGRGGDMFGEDDYDDVKVTARPERRKEDLEIVEFELREVSR